MCGLTVLCGARIRFKDSTKQKLILTNTSVAFLQLVTAFLFLLGWIWSIVWGVAFITISSRCTLKFNPYKQNGISHSYQLNQSISALVFCHFYSNFSNSFCKQIVEALISRLPISHKKDARLIWVNTTEGIYCISQ